MRPLAGINVVEVAGLGAAPFGVMMLAQFGARVIRVDRIPTGASSDPGSAKDSLVDAGRESIALDLKSPAALEVLLTLIKGADVLIEAFRPGVAERLGFGPDICQSLNPGLIYARMTGWGQSGPLSASAGHDLNYISISGILHATGYADRPPMPPLNLIGDYGGGGLLMAMGVCCALIERTRSGKGQVVDAAMSDGSIFLATEIYSQLASRTWSGKREDNLLDGGAPFYRVYQCADGEFISIGAIERQFFALLLERCGVKDVTPSQQWQKSEWPRMTEVFSGLFRSKTRQEWQSLLEGTDVCFAPVLSLAEAPTHPHNVARGAFQGRDGRAALAPAPRLSRTPAALAHPAPRIGENSERILRELGCDEAAVRTLLASGAAFQSSSHA